MGALDVCPFIPIAGVSEEECVQVSKNFGARLGQEVSSSVVDFSLAKDIVFPSICWLSFTAVSASLSLRGGVHSKLQVVNLFLHLLMYECVPLSFKEKTSYLKEWHFSGKQCPRSEPESTRVWKRRLTSAKLTTKNYIPFPFCLYWTILIWPSLPAPLDHNLRSVERGKMGTRLWSSHFCSNLGRHCHRGKEWHIFLHFLILRTNV